MEDISARTLALPESERAQAGQTWQQRKSIQTRIVILEAAIDCLQTHGYGRTTTQLIAETAGISRGAMLHHYATKQQLIASVIDYTLYKRMEAFLAGVRALKESERVAGMVGIELFWDSLQTREFGAYLELVFAARTDAELAKTFLPKARIYDQTELARVISAFPEWAEQPEAYALAMDYCNSALQGLFLNKAVWNEPEQVELRRFVGKSIAMMLSGELALPPTAEPHRELADA
jgi:AcrR family transcriptional regulator